MNVLALDMGSSSVRAAVCDASASIVDGLMARRTVAPHQEENGRGELDPDVYVAKLVACIDDLAERGALDDIGQVATSSQWHSILAVDAESGRPRGHALSWLDTRAPMPPTPDDPEAFHARTGGWAHTLYWTAKIPWLRAHRGAAPMRFLSLVDYVRRILLGEEATSVSMASGTGLVDIERCVWDPEALELAGVRESDLPTISDQPGRLVGRWRERWPTLVDVPWHPATGDGAASNFGSGCSTSSSAAVTVGTSLALRVVHEESIPLPWEVWRYRVDSRRYVSGIAFSGGGVLHAWAVGLLRLDEHFDPSKVRPGRSGLTVVPLHAGSRPPWRMPPGSGAVLGLSLDTSPEDMVAGTLDGVSVAAAGALERLDAMIGRGKLDVTLGGGAAYASEWWQRSFAAAFDRPVRVVRDPEVGARGAAAVALGVDCGHAEEVVRPDPDDVEALARTRQAYDRMAAWMDNAFVASGGADSPADNRADRPADSPGAATSP